MIEKAGHKNRQIGKKSRQPDRERERKGDRQAKRERKENNKIKYPETVDLENKILARRKKVI